MARFARIAPVLLLLGCTSADPKPGGTPWSPGKADGAFEIGVREAENHEVRLKCRDRLHARRERIDVLQFLCRRIQSILLLRHLLLKKRNCYLAIQYSMLLYFR